MPTPICNRFSYQGLSLESLEVHVRATDSPGLLARLRAIYRLWIYPANRNILVSCDSFGASKIGGFLAYSLCVRGVDVDVEAGSTARRIRGLTPCLDGTRAAPSALPAQAIRVPLRLEYAVELEKIEYP